MRRINQILDIIKENKIVDGVFPIVKVTKKQIVDGVFPIVKVTKKQIVDGVFPIVKVTLTWCFHKKQDCYEKNHNILMFINS